jgi:hypothetical protein
MNNEDALYSLRREFANLHLVEGAPDKHRGLQAPKFQ